MTAFRSCSDPGALVEILGIQVSPDPPKRSEPVVTTWQVIARAEIEQGASMTVEATIGGISLPTTQINICEELRKNGIPCPIDIGEHALRLSIDVPIDVPPFVTIHLRLSARNADGAQLYCVQGAIKFAP